MYWSSTGKIESAELVVPAVGVPCPACDGIVDESSPDEDEKDEWPESGAFCHPSESNHRSGKGASDLEMRVKSRNQWSTYVMAANMSW